MKWLVCHARSKRLSKRESHQLDGSAFGVARHEIQSESVGPHCLRAHQAAQVSDFGVLRDWLKLGKLDQRLVEVVWAGKVEGSDEHIGLDHRGARRISAVRREPESSRCRREVILEVAGRPWDMRRLVAPHRLVPSAEMQCLEIHAPAAPAAGAAAAEAELPVEEPPQPDDDRAGFANTPPTASGRRMYIADAMVKKFGASMSCPR